MVAPEPLRISPSKCLGTRRVLGACAAGFAASLAIAPATATPAVAATTTYAMTDLGSLGYGVSYAFGINASAQITGRSYLTQTAPVSGCPPRHTCVAHLAHAFSWSAGTMTDLASLGGIYSEGRASNSGTLGGSLRAAYAINGAGQVAGWAHTQSEATHAFLYTGGKMTDLGAYNIDTVGEAINSAGVLVGQTYGVDGSGNPFYHAFVYSGGAFQDLNNLIPAGSGWELTDAAAINDKGPIAANGYSATTGKTHAFLLNPM